MTFQNGVVRTLARQQQSTALSSCESELYALQLVSQESVALSRLIQRLYLVWDGNTKVRLFNCHGKRQQLSNSVGSGIDLPKRSRHIGIRLEWLRDKLESEEITLIHNKG